MINARKNKAKRHAESVARQMNYARYMPNIYERIQNAVTETEISELLFECRRRWCEADYARL